MGFHNVNFPDDINYGSRGGPGFSTSVVEMDSGQEERVAHWDGARHRYNAAYGIKSIDDLAELITFYICRKGPAYGFRFKDYMDFSTAANHRDAPSDVDFVIGTGDASEVDFQLLKTYSNGGVVRTRSLTKPVSGTVQVTLEDLFGNFVAMLEGVNYNVNYLTGVITFTSPPASGHKVWAGCEFDVPVRFGQELDLVLSLAYSTFSTGGIEDVPLVEIVDDILEDEFYYGGSIQYNQSLETPVPAAVTLGTRVWIITLNLNAVSIQLPDPVSPQVLPGGGPYFYIFNHSDSLYSLTVEDHNAVALKVLAAGEGCVCILEESTPEWFAM